MIDEFAKYLKKDRKSIKTIVLYSKIVEEFMDWYSSNHSRSFQHLNTKDITEFEYYLKSNKGYKDETIKVKLSVVAKFNEFLIHYNF